MGEFQVEVVRVENVQKHPNADTLSICNVFGGYPVVIKSDAFKEGDKAVYIPVDSLVPLQEARFSFLSDSANKTRHRIRAKKIRSIFSMGMLVPSEQDWQVGQNVQTELNIEKWEPKVQFSAGQQTQDPGIIPMYTDFKSLRRYSYILNEGEEVVVTEKIHGANSRYVYDRDEFWVGSHRQFKKRDPSNMWWKLAEKYDLESKLKSMPGIALYGEAYGAVQDLRYGLGQQIDFAVFDIFDCKAGRYLDYDDFQALCAELKVPTVPVLMKGSWNESLTNLAEGKSRLADHIREGFVVRPVKERYHDRIGRVAFKLIGQGYLLRKESQ